MEVREPDGLGDYRRAVECHNRAWRVGYRTVVPGEVIESVLRPTDDQSLRALRNEVEAEPGAFLVAERDDRVVGYVRARYAGVSEFVGRMGGELVALYVDPAHWRVGVGSALLGSCVEWLPSSIEGLDARVVADNERGRAFLEAHDLVHEETVDLEVGGESVEHAIYRVGLEDDATGADDAVGADVGESADVAASADVSEGTDVAAADAGATTGADGSEPSVTTVSDVPAPGSFGASETPTNADDTDGSRRAEGPASGGAPHDADGSDDADGSGDAEGSDERRDPNRGDDDVASEPQAGGTDEASEADAGNSAGE